MAYQNYELQFEPSGVQVREKVVAREKPKWEPYAAYLQPMIQRLQSGQNSNQA